MGEEGAEAGAHPSPDSPTVPAGPVAAPFRMEPFHGLMLAPSAVGDPASARLFARPYHEVPNRLTHWTSAGRLRWDAEPALYVHEYTSDGITVRGLVGAVDLTHAEPAEPRRATRPGDARPGDAVFPHEGVHPEQVAALAERMAAMRVNPAPILLVHRGPEAVRRLLAGQTERGPDLVFADRQGQVQRVWALRDPLVHRSLEEGLAGAHALIADGHHRYAAYRQLAERHPGTPWSRGLAMLVDQSDTPLWLGAIHRFLAGQELGELRSRLAGLAGVRVEQSSRADAFDRLGPQVLVVTDDENWLEVTLPDPDLLAVTAFDTVILPALGVARRAVSFQHSVEEALRQPHLRPGVSVLMPSPPFDAVVESALTGRLLPEKATSFQPKPSLGVLMRNLSDE